MGLLDVKSHALRTLSSNAPRYVGFFNPKWSPDGRRLAFLSVDMNASVQAWIWAVGADVASPVGNLDIRAGFNDPPMAWVGNDRIAMLAWDVGAAKSGNLYAKILRGGHMVDEWKRAADARLPTVSVLESGRYTEQKGPSARLVVFDVKTNAAKTLARGRMHNLSGSVDGRFLKFDQEQPGVPGQAVSFYFALATPDVDTAYVAVNRGAATHVIDA